MERIRGLVQAISRYGGIRIGNKWYNPYPKDKEKIFADKDELAGSMVELALDDKGKVIGYTITEEKEEPEKEEEKKPREELKVKKPPEVTNKMSQRPPTNQEMVVRENALRHSTQLSTAVFSALSKEKQEKITIDDLTETTLRIASKIEDWIKRGC